MKTIDDKTYNKCKATQKTTPTIQLMENLTGNTTTIQTNQTRVQQQKDQSQL